MDIGLFDKYKDIGFKSSGTLFQLDFRVATKEHRCPYCFCKLYEMRRNPNLMYCKSKSHIQKFIIDKSKMK